MEVSLHAERPATGQLDQDFPWFYSIPQQMLQSVYKFHVTLLASHAALPVATAKLCSNAALQTLI
jgi:hypothetical protein